MQTKDTWKCWIVHVNNCHEVVSIGVKDKNNGLYHLQTIVLKEINDLENLDDIDLWHKHMVHLSYQSLHFMSKQQKVNGMPMLD